MPEKEEVVMMSSEEFVGKFSLLVLGFLSLKKIAYTVIAKLNFSKGYVKPELDRFHHEFYLSLI